MERHFLLCTSGITSINVILGGARVDSAPTWPAASHALPVSTPSLILERIRSWLKEHYIKDHGGQK